LFGPSQNLASDTTPLNETPIAKPLSQYRRVAAFTHSPDEVAKARNDWCAPPLSTLPPSRASTRPRNDAPASLPLAATVTGIATPTMVAMAPRMLTVPLTWVCGARVSSPIYDGATPKTQPAMNHLTKKYAPHQAHKHHYGWVRIYPVPSVLSL
jgi:hypothetical protein